MSATEEPKPDGALMDRLRTAEPAAWRIAFSRLWPLACRAARTATPDTHAAEEAAAAALRELGARAAALRSWAETEALTVVMARRRALSARRELLAAKRGGGAVESLETVAAVALPDPAAAGAALDLAAMLAQLGPPRDRIVREHFIEGRTSDEIGARLGLKPATVRSHLLRALQELRKWVATPAR